MVNNGDKMTPEELARVLWKRHNEIEKLGVHESVYWEALAVAALAALTKK